MKRKVVLFGGGAKRRYFRKEKNTDYWMLNGQQMGPIGKLVRPTAVFNLHKLKLLQQYGYDLVPEARWHLRNKRVPFFTMDRWHKKIRTRNFPVQPLFAMPNGRYHCGSFDWLVAYGILCRYKEIELHGINLCLEGSEPMASQACLEFWCCYAMAKGIKVTATKDSTLFCYIHKVLTNRIYGWDDAPIYEDHRYGARQYDYRR